MSEALPMRFAQGMGHFYQMEMRRIHVEAAPAAAEQKKAASNSRHANSKKSVDTRKAKYSESKLKRGTRKEMKQAGHKVRGD